MEDAVQFMRGHLARPAAECVDRHLGTAPEPSAEVGLKHGRPRKQRLLTVACAIPGAIHVAAGHGGAKHE